MDTLETALAITIILAIIYIGSWVIAFIKWRKAQKKTVASKPVEYFTYDSKANVKRVGHELRVKTWGKEETK